MLTGNLYEHIKFPKANFIMKRGRIVDYKTILGKEVVVTKVKTTKNSITKIIVKQKDSKRFFNSLPSVTIDLEKALVANEINVLYIKQNH